MKESLKRFIEKLSQQKIIPFFGWTITRISKSKIVWKNGSERVIVESFPGSWETYYRDKSKEESVRKMLTNDHCSRKEAIWVAKLYMDYGLITTSCNIRIPSKKGVKFKSLPIGVIKDYIENSDKEPPQALEELRELGKKGAAEDINKNTKRKKVRNHPPKKVNY